MDVHQATISVAVMDAGGKLMMECLLETKAATIVEIAYELVARTIHKRSVAKRLNELFYAIAEGQELQATARQITDERSLGEGEWSHAVQEWIKVTRKTLEHCSAQAVISFMHDPDLTLTHLGSIGAPSEYESLVLRLNNLRCIMEHPEAYFPG